jgi:hypothetical protein
VWIDLMRAMAAVCACIAPGIAISPRREAVPDSLYPTGEEAPRRSVSVTRPATDVRG